MKETNSKINSHTELYCIFGNPVRHSFSPVMHNLAFTECGINAVYLAFEVKSIREGISAMRSLPIRGASVTIPFKIDVMAHLDSIDPLAGRIGSVNTLVNRGGEISGHNTDGPGAIMALEENGVELKGRSCLIIGNGGSARAIAFTLIEHGASVTITGRNRVKISSLADDLNKFQPAADTCLIDELSETLMKRVDIIINTTPVGMNPDNDRIPIKPELITRAHTVFDIIYSPHETVLLKEAKEKGSVIIHGIDMLINQGIIQFEIWTDQRAPVAVMKHAAYTAIKK